MFDLYITVVIPTYAEKFSYLLAENIGTMVLFTLNPIFD